MVMSNKEERILYKIKEDNNIPITAKFIQHRNLKEFKFFKIEKINPTHRLFLYGKLKNNHPKRDDDKFIKAGEIIISGLMLYISVDMLLHYINIICLLFSIYCIVDVLFFIVIRINITGGIYDNWYRRRFGRWQNYLYG